MSKRKLGNTQLLAIVVVAIIGGTMFAPQIMQFGADVASGFGWGVPVIGPDLPEDQLYAAHTFTLYKEGTTTAVASATVYAWYDWDGDGLVDLGQYGVGDGEIETLSSAATTGVVSTAVEYPIGLPVSYQIQASGYETNTWDRTRNSIPVAHDGSALAVTNVFIRASADGTLYVNHVADGTIYYLNATTNNNYTSGTYGDDFTLSFSMLSNTTDSGLGEDAYTDWGTGYDYTGAFVGITMTATVFAAIVPTGWDAMHTVGTNVYLIYDVAKNFNDAGITGDETATLFDLSFNSLTTGSFTAYLFSGIKTSLLASGGWGSTYEIAYYQSATFYID